LDELINQHSTAIIYILCGVITLLAGALAFFLKIDRKRFLDMIEETKKLVNTEINKLNDEVDSVKENYNNKFQVVYEKQDAMKNTMNQNHITLMQAIHKIDIKVTELKR